MKRLLPILLLLLSWQAPQTVINVPIDAFGGTEPALLFVPKTGAAGAPLLVFLHGSGEAGTDLSRIFNSASAGGPAYYIAHGLWPDALPFVVLSPQANNNYSTSGPSLDKIVQYMVSTYGVRDIYLTGLSAGGDGIYQYATHIGVIPKWKPKAIVPMSMSTDPSQAGVNQTIADNVYVWGFGSESDIWGIKTHLYIVGSYGGNNGPEPPGLGALGRFTSYAGGHCCWGPLYDPRRSEDIYTWMLTVNQSPLALQRVELRGNNGGLTWTVDDKDDIDHFEIQESNDNKIFNTIGITHSYMCILQEGKND